MRIDLKIYYINLQSSHDRRRFMESQLSSLGIPYERINAVEGKRLDWSNLKQFAIPSKIKEFPKLLTPNMVGASLSHFEAYKKILEDGVEFGIVLEDDIILKNDFRQLVNNIDTNAVNKSDVFLLYFHGTKKHFAKRPFKNIAGSYKAHPAISTWGDYSAGGYLISRHVADKLSKHVFPVHTTPDSWGTFYRDNIIGGLWAILPLTTQSANFGSDIGYHPFNRVLRLLEKVPFLPFYYIFKKLRRIFYKGISQYEIVGKTPDWYIDKVGRD